MKHPLVNKNADRNLRDAYFYGLSYAVDQLGAPASNTWENAIKRSLILPIDNNDDADLIYSERGRVSLEVVRDYRAELLLLGEAICICGKNCIRGKGINKFHSACEKIVCRKDAKELGDWLCKMLGLCKFDGEFPDECTYGVIHAVSKEGFRYLAQQRHVDVKQFIECYDRVVKKIVGNVNDKDLEFLYGCTNEELIALSEIIRGKGWVTSSLDDQENMDVGKIIHEIQLYGGNTLVNFIRRGNGVPYREILKDNAKRWIRYDDNSSVEEIEKNLLKSVWSGVIREARKKGQEAERNLWLDIVGEQNKQFIDELLHEEVQKLVEELFDAPCESQKRVINSTKSNRYIDLIGQAAVPFVSAILKKIVIKNLPNLFARLFLGQAAKYAFLKGVGSVLGVICGPAGWMFLLAEFITAPAMRVTVPCCIYIASLRMAKRIIRTSK